MNKPYIICRMMTAVQSGFDTELVKILGRY